MYNPPDKPLVVKCTFDKWNKRITFSSARNCSYDLLRRKVEQCFSLYAASYAIAYKDDDGEITNISTDDDLTEAIQYFHVGDDAPTSSAASILSGRSFGAKKITLRVTISVDYDGPSLSDTSSLASLDEFRSGNAGQRSFSFGTPSVAEQDDDSVTVSSRDPASSARGSCRRPFSILSKQKSWSGSKPSHDSTPRLELPSLNGQPSSTGGSSRQRLTTAVSHSDLTAAARYPEDPSAVFERLRFSEQLQDDSSSVDFDASRRGAAWLKDQKDRAIRSKLGALPAPSDADSFSLSLDSQESIGGDLALEKDRNGKYYYNYTSSASQSLDGEQNDHSDAAFARNSLDMRGPRPTSMQLNWLAAQQIDSSGHSHKSKSDLQSVSIPEELPHEIPPDIDKDLLPYITIEPAPHDILTDCSGCGVLLDSIRYICSTCGEKAPVSAAFGDKGKEKENSSAASPHSTYPPPGHSLFSSPNSSSSRTYVASPTGDSSFMEANRTKPLPSIPSSLSSLHSLFGAKPRISVPGSPTSSRSGSIPSVSTGYELCSMCLESVGIHHAIEAGLAAPGSSPVVSTLTPGHDDAQRASQWRRAPPKKGQLRHAYREKVWGHFGWEDVVLDEAQVAECSTCSAITERKRYKCVSCSKMLLCRACYSQVHETHPSHAFCIVPDKPAEKVDESVYAAHELQEAHDENSLIHPGVKCAHCLLDIVGARFHCAICDAVDICSNCESAGLPGNLDSADGGHNSSHILIKIPYPLETTELRNASRRAVHLWTGRDAAHVAFGSSKNKTGSEISSYAQTLIGNGARSPDDHRMLCNGCGGFIIGTRYQCAHCPSKPNPYNLCSNCEASSYQIHDPTHIFFKLPRPVNRPLESPYPFLPPLYKIPAGPPSNFPNLEDPKAYLANLVHSSALCDRCMTPIQGEWFRCSYCSRDLCDGCEEVDTHDDTHVFIVFKSNVDMQLFKNFANLESQDRGRAIITYALYDGR